jgi:hypothetical protein
MERTAGALPFFWNSVAGFRIWDYDGVGWPTGLFPLEAGTGLGDDDVEYVPQGAGLQYGLSSGWSTRRWACALFGFCRLVDSFGWSESLARVKCDSTKASGSFFCLTLV